MHSTLIIAINLAYCIIAYIIIWKVDLPVFRNSLLAMPSATVFLASVFFTIGLLAFDIPLGVLGGDKPSTVAKMKDVWWGLPLVFFVIFILALCLELFLSRIKKFIYRR
jgi:hypothetical protein